MKFLPIALSLLFLCACGAASPAVPAPQSQAPLLGAAAGKVPVAVDGVAKNMWAGIKTDEDEEVWVHALESRLETAGFKVVRPHADRTQQPGIRLRINLASNLIGGELQGSLELRHYAADWGTDEAHASRYTTKSVACGKTGGSDPKISEDRWTRHFAEACATVLVDSLIGSPQLAWHVENLPSASERAGHEPGGVAFSLPGLGHEEMAMGAAPAPVVAMRGATASTEAAPVVDGAGIGFFDILALRGTAPELAESVGPVVAEAFAGTCVQPVAEDAFAVSAKELGESDCRSDLCWAKIAAAAGARYYVSGALVQVSGNYLLSLRLTDAQNQKQVASVDEPVSEAALAEGVRAAAAKLAAKLPCAKKQEI